MADLFPCFIYVGKTDVHTALNARLFTGTTSSYHRVMWALSRTYHGFLAYASVWAWQQRRLCFLMLEKKKVKVMVPICRRQCWVTVCNGVNKSNINFSENTRTVCQPAENLKYLKGLEDKVVCCPRMQREVRFTKMEDSDLETFFFFLYAGGWSAFSFQIWGRQRLRKAHRSQSLSMRTMWSQQVRSTFVGNNHNH